MNGRLGASLVVCATALLAACSTGGGGGSSALPAGSERGVHPLSIATAAPTPTPTPVPVTGTLYYSTGSDTAYALPLNASGTVAPSRAIKPNTTPDVAVAHMVTEADGTLVMAGSYQNPSTDNSECYAAVMPADASGAGSPPIRTIARTKTSADSGCLGVSRNKQGGFDLLYGGDPGQFVDRLANDGATLVNTLAIPDQAWSDTQMAAATFAAGHDYLLSPGTAAAIRKYLAADTTETSAEGNCVDADPHGLAPFVAVAPNGTLYVVRLANETQPTNPSIDAVTSCPTGGAAATVSRTIGPFRDSSVTAMAVDGEGDLYVALRPNAGGAASIRVYGSWANDSAGNKPAPMRVINPSPPQALIYSLTVYDTTGQF